MKVKCLKCNGTGMEICDNPDHGFIGVVDFPNEGRAGCPCCGYDELHRIPNSVCDTCNGSGEIQQID